MRQISKILITLAILSFLIILAFKVQTTLVYAEGDYFAKDVVENFKDFEEKAREAQERTAKEFQNHEIRMCEIFEKYDDVEELVKYNCTELLK